MPVKTPTTPARASMRACETGKVRAGGSSTHSRSLRT